MTLNLMERITTDWNDHLQSLLEESWFHALTQSIEEAYQRTTVYPEKEHIFEALNLTSFKNTKVVILGQDPYHGSGQAHGLSFSVPEGVAHPPSLRNIFKELQADLGCEVPESGSLTRWAEAGVLMLNTVLTVEKGHANSHRDKGWELFTNEVIKCLNNKQTPIVYILWGKPAQSKARFIDETKHLIIRSPHPSPLSSYRGFFGSKPFSQTNHFLATTDQEPIRWCLV